jgi:cytochrome c peroxidase
MRKVSIIGVLLSIIFFWTACKPRPVDEIVPEMADDVLVFDLPVGFPDLTFPVDNQPTSLRVELGKQLFYDTRLSREGNLSCASCHLPQNAFADPRAVSIGTDGRTGLRNAPTLANVAWQPHLFMDGGVPSLELQVMHPFNDPLEFDLHIVDAANQLASDENYAQMSLSAYDRPLDPFVIMRAISSFERTLISGNSAYDRFLAGDEAALSSDAQAGMALFFSPETGCSDCHNGVFFTDFSFQNVGLYATYADNGRQRVTGDPSDEGKFKVPTLRNVALTAPYMHDGSLSTLADVVAHFNAGGELHSNQHPAVRPLNLNPEQQAQLIVFLEALTDESFINNPDFR